MRLKLALFSIVLCICVLPSLYGQDSVKTDPTHYSIVSENADVRILKVHYGPHEKSAMHSHPASVAVFLTQSTALFTFPDGKTQTVSVKPGDAIYSAAQVHSPENTGKTGLDLILVELKGKTDKPSKTEMK